MTDIQKLKALAEAATPGPWVKTIDGVMPEGAKFGIFGNPTSENGAANREYIAAANPAAVLELIAEIELLREECEAHLELIGKQGAAHMHEKLGTFDEYQNANASLANERDRLKAENERLELENEDTLKKYEEAVEGFTKLSAEVLGLRQQLAVPSDVLADCEALRLENEALRKDAELSNVGRAKLAGAMSRLRAKHNDWTLPDRLPEAELVWCGCGDGYPSTSYGAGYMAANGGACENCHAAPSKEAQS
jgi:hypothetical protein